MALWTTSIPRLLNQALRKIPQLSSKGSFLALKPKQRKVGLSLRQRRTGLIQFTSSAIARRGIVDSAPLSFQGQEIHPRESIKILRVTLDNKLRMDTHISKVMVSAISKYIALQLVKGLRPRQMR